MRNKHILIIFFIIFNFINPIHSFSCQNLIEEEKYSLVLGRSKVLNLVGRSIDDEKAIKLSILLKDNKIVHEVNVHSNKIGNVGIKKLGEAFETLTNLKKLHVSCNLFDMEGASSLLLSLKKLRSLEYLDLRQENLNDDLIPLLADVVKENPQIELLLYGNVFSKLLGI